MGFRPKPARVTSTPAARVSTRGRQRTSIPLSASMTGLFSIIENASDVMFTHDGQGNFSWVNAAAERVSGYSRSELLEMNLLDLLSPEQARIEHERWSKRNPRELPQAFTAEIIAKDGSTKNLDISHSLISDDGLSHCILSIGRDVTHHVLGERALRESEARFRAF